MRAAVLVLLIAPAVFAQSALDLQGYVAARGVDADTPRLGDGDDLSGVAQFGIEWRPSQFFGLHVSGAAYDEEAGLIEAYADLRATYGLNEVQLRAGQFFLPTSREHKGELWTSTYSVGFSALNSWIAEEVRPIGLDLEWRHVLPHGHVITAAATAFRGNDTMGALLGWRGFVMGNRLSAYGEVVPLPPLPDFPDQRTDGSRPFGRDLDGNTGYAARVRYAVPERGNIQYAWLDNRGDRRLYRGEYAWETAYHQLGVEIGNPGGLIVAAEAMRGETGMGFPPQFVQARFHAAYALISKKQGRNRWTARLDLFAVDERAHDESGRSGTLAWLFDVTPALRAGAELTEVRGDDFEGKNAEGRRVTLELRYTF